MGQQKRTWEKSIPVYEKKTFEKELDFLVFSKEKSQKPIPEKKPDK